MLRRSLLHFHKRLYFEFCAVVAEGLHDVIYSAMNAAAAVKCCSADDSFPPSHPQKHLYVFMI